MTPPTPRPTHPAILILGTAFLMTTPFTSAGCAPAQRELAAAPVWAAPTLDRRPLRKVATHAAQLPPARKLSIIQARVPDGSALPSIIGQLGHYRVGGGESLLSIARKTGVGFRELRDGNPTIDEWEPKIGTDLVIPTRWIVPRTDSYRGLVINVPEMRLYMFPTDTFPGERVPVLTWPIGIGAEEAPSPIGPFTILSKDENPTWVVPDSIYRKMERPQRVVPPGPDNPLGEYRIRLDKDLYAIHGTNDPWTVGRLTTHGCIRLYPEDIEMLYPLVDRGTPGEMIYQPVKIGERGGDVYVEVHKDVYQRFPDLERHAFDEIARAGVQQRVDPALLRAAVKQKRGIPVNVSRGKANVTTASANPAGTDDADRGYAPDRREHARSDADALSSREPARADDSAYP